MKGKLAFFLSSRLRIFLEIAQTERGLRVIEINGFNSSGFYAGDISQIVRDVSTMVMA
ncbi:MAG: ATP-grasp domain-containing protein [bacterium]|nr:ATP-grasp domain-containing protein [bacterium]